MLMRKFRILISVVSLVALVAIPAIAEDRDDQGDRDHKASSMVVGGDFDLAVLDAGMVEASFIAEFGLSVSSIEIRGEELIFGPVHEIEPGVWSATAFAPDGTDCYQATADVVLTKKSISDRGEDEKGDDDRPRSRSVNDHRDKKKNRFHDDDRDERDGAGKHDAPLSYSLRMGASVCAPLNSCAPPSAPGPGPGLPPGVAPLPTILTPLGLYP